MALLIILGVSVILYIVLQVVIKIKEAQWNDDGTWGPNHRDYSGHK